MKFHSTVLVSTLLLIAPSSVAVAAHENVAVPSVQLAQTPSERTYTTVRTDGGIDIQITDGNFRASTTLRPGENAYVGRDGIAVINLIPSTGQVTVFSSETGETFYDYYISPISFDNPLGPTAVAQRSTPTTYMIRTGPNTIVVQITDGNFFFRDEMYRSYGNSYQATDHGIRVIYDGDSDRVVVISDETGEEFYNYFFDASFSNANDSSASSGGYAQPTPETYLTRENANEYTAELIEGEFYFYGPLTRTSGNTFVGADNQVRVMYDADTSGMVVINVVTGTEFYNYFFSTVDEGYL